MLIENPTMQERYQFLLYHRFLFLVPAICFAVPHLLKSRDICLARIIKYVILQDVLASSTEVQFHGGGFGHLGTACGAF